MCLRLTIRMLLSVLLILNGCSVGGTGKLTAVPDRSPTVGLATPEEDEAIIAGEKALVVMRLNITLDGEPLESPGDYVEFGLGSIYWTGLLPVVPKVASEEAKREGWIYLVLNSGRYNFWVLPPGGSPKDFRFQIEVPDKSLIVYTGSLRITCSKSGSCDKPELQRNQAPALEFSDTLFAYLGKPSIAMMEPYAPPANRIPKDPFPMAVLVQGAPKPLDVIQPEVTEPERSYKSGRGPGMPHLGPLGGGDAAGAVIALGVLGTVLVIIAAAKAIEATAKEIEHFVPDKTQSEEQKRDTSLRACQASLLAESAIFQSDPIGLASLVEGLKKQGPTRLVEVKPDEDLFSKARQQGSRSLLQTGLMTVGLGVAEDNSACLQTAVVARLWDVETTKLLYEKILLRRCDGNSTVLSPFLRARLPFGAYDDSHVFDDKSTQYLQSISSACYFRRENRLAARFSPNGKLLTSGGADHSVILWDVATQRQLGSPLQGHDSSVNDVTFSPDGKLLASGSSDNTVILWDVANRTQVGEPLKGHNSSVNGVTFSPDGRLLAAGSAETVRVWDVTSRAPVAELIEQPTAVRQTFASAMDTATRMILEDFRLGTNSNQ